MLPVTRRAEPAKRLSRASDGFTQGVMHQQFRAMRRAHLAEMLIPAVVERKDQAERIRTLRQTFMLKI